MHFRFLPLIVMAILMRPLTTWAADSSPRDFCKKEFDGLRARAAAAPQDAKAWAEFRACVIELKRWHDGDVAATQALKANPELPDAHLLLGIARLHSKAYAKAAESLDESIRIKPDNANAYYYLGMTYLFQGMPLEASKAAQRAVELEPTRSANHGQLAYAYFLLDEQASCEAAAKKAIELDADNVAAYKVLGNLYGKQGRQADSDHMFEEAIHANGRIAASNPVAARQGLPGMVNAAPPPLSRSIASGAIPPTPVRPAQAAEKDEEETPASKAAVEAFLQQQWTGMKEALKAGQTARALNYYSDYADTRDKYLHSFQQLGPERVKAMFSNMGEVEDCEIVFQAATCRMTISSAGTLHVTRVRFERNADKVWRIRSF